MADRRYDPQTDRAQVAGDLGARAHVGGLQRARQRPRRGRAREVLRARDAALPERRAAHRAPEELRARATRSPTSTAAPGSACCTRWATTRSACRPRTTRSRPASTRAKSTNKSIAAFQRCVPLAGGSRSTGRGSSPRTSRLLPLDPVDLPEAVRARPGLPQGGGGQVVPHRPDRAGQRAGDRRALRALRRTWSRSRQLEQWFFRITDYADRLLDDLDDDRLARARQGDAAQLDRPQRGRRGHVPLRGARDRLPRVHDPARHAVRRDLLRDGARAPRRVPARRRHRVRAAGPRVRQPRADRVGRGARRRREAEDRRAARAARSPTRSTASRSRCSSPTTC